MRVRGIPNGPVSLVTAAEPRVLWPAALLAASVLILASARAFGAPPAGPPPWAKQVVVPSAEEATRSLLALDRQYRDAAAGDRPQALRQLIDAATTRQQLLAAIIADDPATVLRVAIPAALRANMPAAVQAYVEQQTTLDGELEVAIEDRPASSVTHYTLKGRGGERVALHFAAGPPEIETGSQVTVTGVQVDQTLALTSGGASMQVQSLALTNTFGAQKTLVLLVNFQDKATQPYTVATAKNTVFTTTSNWDLENSFQQTWLTGDVYGWYTLPLSSTTCDTTAIATYAKQAATAAGVNLAAYTRYVFAFPDTACTWWGLGTVGGNPSQAWVNGSFALKVVAHEMGHNLGLYHSHAWECGTTTLGPSCTAIEYGDTLDMMGNPSSGHFNAYQKERLGWLNYGSSPPITTVLSSGAYAIDPYESAGTNPKALKVLKSTDPTTGKNTWYYVELRRPLGADGFLSSNTNVLNGVVVHSGAESSGNSSNLLDMTALTDSWSDPALGVGQTFYDPDAGVTIVPTAVSSTGATVSVTYGPLACTAAPPTIALAPSATQWAPPGGAVTYTLVVTNNDNSACSTSTFGLQSSVPSGWAAAFGAASLVLAPGASASTSYTVTPAASAANGFYGVGAAVAKSTDVNASASVTGTISVLTALDVKLTASQASYTRTQTIALTATVSTAGSPIANAAVAFTLTKADGSKITANAMTGTNGTAAFSARLKKQDPAGTYQAGAVATLSGITGSATTSVVVK